MENHNLKWVKVNGILLNVEFIYKLSEIIPKTFRQFHSGNLTQSTKNRILQLQKQDITRFNGLNGAGSVALNYKFSVISINNRDEQEMISDSIDVVEETLFEVANSNILNLRDDEVNKMIDASITLKDSFIKSKEAFETYLNNYVSDIQTFNL